MSTPFQHVLPTTARRIAQRTTAIAARPCARGQCRWQHSQSPGETSQRANNESPGARPGQSIEQIRARLRSQQHHLKVLAAPHIAELNRRVQRSLANLAQRVAALSLKLNEVTGYHEVERLKAMVASQEATLESARAATRRAKTAYDEAVANRSNAQRDVNSLLERKHSWTDADVSQFTTLVRADHASSSAVVSTSSTLKDQELAVDKAFSDLTNAILQRYHEEQVWSDKIRSVATWANVVGLLVNFLIFVIAIAIVEPWKRKRLVERVEERMTTLIGRLEDELRDVKSKVTPVVALSEPFTRADGVVFGNAGTGEILADMPASVESEVITGIATPTHRSPFSVHPSIDSHIHRALAWPPVSQTHDYITNIKYNDPVIAAAGGAVVGAILCFLPSLFRS